MNANLYDENGNLIGHEIVETDNGGVAEYPARREGFAWCAMGYNAEGVPCFRLMEI